MLFFRILIIFNVLGWVLLGFTGFYWVLLGFTELYWVWLGLTGFDWVLLGSTGFYWVLLGFTELYWVWLGLTGFDWVWLGFARFYWVLLGFTGFYWATRGRIGEILNSGQHIEGHIADALGVLVADDGGSAHHHVGVADRLHLARKKKIQKKWHRNGSHRKENTRNTSPPKFPFSAARPVEMEMPRKPSYTWNN